MRERAITGTPLGDGADASTMLAVAFPHDQVQILSYNRTVKDLGGLAPGEFMETVRERFEVRRRAPSRARPVDAARGAATSRCISGGQWHTLRPRAPPDPSDAIGSLDVSVLQERLLAPILKIADVRTDKRIDFVGGARGTRRARDSWSTRARRRSPSRCYPVSVADLMAVSDAGAIMPPKSTWFEPKLRDGLLIH